MSEELKQTLNDIAYYMEWLDVKVHPDALLNETLDELKAFRDDLRKRAKTVEPSWL